MKPLFLVCLFLLIASCQKAQVQTVDRVSNSDTKTISNEKFDINKFLNKQILLSNKAKFKGNRNLNGASGFLIKYKETIYAVTARHLLGEAGGITPEIAMFDLNKTLISWEMMPRVVSDSTKEIVKINAAGLDYPNSLQDLLLLNATLNSDLIQTLTPSFDLPADGEKLYIIGCPYSEIKCRQNLYEVQFIQYDEAESLLIAKIDSKVNLSGFSGAPLINSQGSIIGVLVGGGENVVAATHIKEIQKIVK